MELAADPWHGIQKRNHRQPAFYASILSWLNRRIFRSLERENENLICFPAGEETDFFFFCKKTPSEAKPKEANLFSLPSQ